MPLDTAPPKAKTDVLRLFVWISGEFDKKLRCGYTSPEKKYEKRPFSILQVTGIFNRLLARWEIDFNYGLVYTLSRFLTALTDSVK